MSRPAETAMPPEIDSEATFTLDPMTGFASSSSDFCEFSRIRTICVAAESHKEPRIEPFQHVVLQLQKQGNCKVVVVVCLTKIMDEMGVWRQVDVQSFSGINQKKLKLHRQDVMTMWNHFLTKSGIRRKLLARGAPVEVCIAAGFPRADVLVEAARAIQPHWMVLDRSFAGSKSGKALQNHLDCTVILAISSEKEKTLKLNGRDRFPSFDHSSGLQGPMGTVNYSEISSNRTSIGSGSLDVSDVGHSHPVGNGSQDMANMRQAPVTSTSSQTHVFRATGPPMEADSGSDYALCICFSDSPTGGGRKAVPSTIPTHGSVVLYEDPSPDARDLQFEQMTTRRTSSSHVELVKSISEGEKALRSPRWLSSCAARKTVNSIMR